MKNHEPGSGSAAKDEQQFLILVKGLPGSGKSTLAAGLASRLRCPLVDKDDTRDALQAAVHQAPHVDWNALSYDVMFRTAARQLGLGLSVVLDCPFARPQLYERACGLVRARGPPAAAATLEAAASAAPAEACSAAVDPVAPAAATADQGQAPALLAERPGPAAAASAAAVVSVAASASAASVAASAASGSAVVVLVDVECGDEAVWRRRVEERGARDAGTEREHKPGSWAALQELLGRYNGSWKWSTDGSVRLPYYVRVCTASASTEECVRHVLGYLQSLEAPGGARPAPVA